MHKVVPWGSHLYLKVHRDKETTKGVRAQVSGEGGKSKGKGENQGCGQLCAVL